MTVTIVSLLLVQALLVPSGAAGTAKFICTIGRGIMPSPLRWFHCFRHGRIYSSHHAYINYLVCVHAIRFL